MTRVSRMWLGTLVCVLGFGAGAARAIEPKYLPSDTEIVVSINIKQALQSDLVKKNQESIDQAKALIEKAIPEDNPAAKYLKSMGFDPVKDLHGITFAMGATTNPEAAFLILEGKFNIDKFNDTAAEAAKENNEKVKVSKVGDNQIIEIIPPGENARLFVTLSGKDMLLVAGSKTALTDAMGRVAGTKKNNLKKDFRSLLETTNAKQTLSIVATGSAIAKLMDDAPIPENQRKQVDVAINMLKNIEGFSIAVTLAKDIQFQLGVNAKDKDTAKNMAQQVQKGLAGLQFILQLQAGDNEKLAPVMDILKTLKVNAQGSNLVIQGQVAPEVIGELLKNLPNLKQ